MGVHQYDTQVAELWPADVTEKKPVWQTEMSGVKWWKEQGPSADDRERQSPSPSGSTARSRSAKRPRGSGGGGSAQGDTNEGLLLANGTDTKRRYTRSAISVASFDRVTSAWKSEEPSPRPSK